MSSRITSFAPLEATPCRLLILGSMPGRESLEQQRYYAHPRNAFWPIMTALLNAARELSYPEKLRLLAGHRISLWDVIGSCSRSGSLDAAIPAASEHPNPISDFCRRHPELEAIAFNGRRAESSFRRHFRREPALSSLRLILLPSTSPAYAALRPDAKLALWRERLAPFLPSDL
jgi:hypoxanthine-DNA glycosylase